MPTLSRQAAFTLLLGNAEDFFKFSKPETKKTILNLDTHYCIRSNNIHTHTHTHTHTPVFPTVVELLFTYKHIFPKSKQGEFLFSGQVMSNSSQPHGLQHARLPCPLPFPRVCSNSCPLSQWDHPTISSSVVPFSSYLQSFPASGSFPMSQFFTAGSQSIGASASASVLPMKRK